MIPKANEIYRHFKGNLYKVLTVAIHSETEEKMVVYQALYGSFPVYCRPLEMFTSKVDRSKYPNANQEFRFEKVEEILDFSEANYPVSELTHSDIVEREVLVEPLKTNENFSDDADLDDEDLDDEVFDNEDFDDDEDEFHTDPVVMDFLEAETVKEKKNILESLHHRITEDMIYTLALAMDIVIDEGSLEERYEQLMYCLNTKEKYEIERRL